QVEMLMKAGLTDIVHDRIEGKLNAKLLDWNEPNPLKSFAVPKVDLQQWLKSSKSADVMGAYKGFLKARLPVTLEQTQLLYSIYGLAWFDRLTVRMKRYGVGYERMTNYLEPERKALGKKKPGDNSMVAGWWCDYVDAAAALGLDMKNPVYLLPKDLHKNHDEKTKAAAALAAREGGRNRVKSLTKRYTFWGDRWLIRHPVSAAEIVAEGEKLKHCVGGYADRHVKGTTTILFLRDKQRPGKPLVTIEMHGSDIMQIHGYKNEAAACRANPKRLSPRELYKDFLDDWLAWIKAGSKRDKNGVPVVPEREKVKVPA
ncbi:MAG: PcfJ domain-containing protein, partial [Pyramidobacter sp.]|nr:PcfJ domain-containing protein [Pyramidobacter sp.]